MDVILSVVLVILSEAKNLAEPCGLFQREGEREVGDELGAGVRDADGDGGRGSGSSGAIAALGAGTQFAGVPGAVAPADGGVALDGRYEGGAVLLGHFVGGATGGEEDAGADVNEARICRQADGRSCACGRGGRCGCREGIQNVCLVKDLCVEELFAVEEIPVSAFLYAAVLVLEFELLAT